MGASEASAEKSFKTDEPPAIYTIATKRDADKVLEGYLLTSCVRIVSSTTHPSTSPGRTGDLIRASLGKLVN